MQKVQPNKAISFLKANTVFVAFVAIFVIASFMYPKFFTYQNIHNVLLQQSIIGVIAVGVTFTILIGGIDLSVSSITVLSAILAAMLDMQGVPLPLTIICSIMAGGLCGVLNGMLVSRLNIPPFIATLATMLTIKGIAFLLHNTSPTDFLKQTQAFSAFSRGKVFGLSVFTIIFIAICIICSIMLRFTGTGRKIYAVGGNAEAANMMGLDVKNIKLLAFTLSGFFSGLAGLMLGSRIGLPQANATSGWEMDAIAAVVLGGTLLTGGIGKISGTFFGVMIVGIISNMINLQGNIMSWVANIITGIVLLVVMVFQSLASNRK